MRRFMHHYPTLDIPTLPGCPSTLELVELNAQLGDAWMELCWPNDSEDAEEVKGRLRAALELSASYVEHRGQVLR